MCRHVRLLQRVEELEGLAPGPAVVLAPLPSLAAGPARRLLADWADTAANLIVLPSRPAVIKTLGMANRHATNAATAAAAGPIVSF